MFADVIIDIQHEKLDKIFQYRIPERLEHEVEAGMAVVVPFGKGNRKTKGYVTALSKTCDYDISKVKEIADISRSGVEIEAKLIALAAWMKEHYGGTMIQALKTVLPIKQKENAKIKKYVRLLLGKERAEAQLHYYQQKNQKARARLLEALLEDPVIEYGSSYQRKRKYKGEKAAQTADRPGDGGKTASLLSGKESESEGASDGGAS